MLENTSSSSSSCSGSDTSSGSSTGAGTSAKARGIIAAGKQVMPLRAVAPESHQGSTGSNAGTPGDAETDSVDCIKAGETDQHSEAPQGEEVDVAYPVRRPKAK